MKYLILVILASSLIFSSCSKPESSVSTDERNSNTSRLPGEFDDEIVDSVFSTFAVGNNNVDPYFIDIYPDDFPADPIETKIYLGERTRNLEWVTLPNGTQIRNCPNKGNACGNVYWMGDKPGDTWQFIGYYSL
jgi:hypothetical protein